MNRDQALSLPEGNRVRAALERAEADDRARGKLSPEEWARRWSEARKSSTSPGDRPPTEPMGVDQANALGREVGRRAAAVLADRAFLQLQAASTRPGEATETLLYRELLAAGFVDLFAADALPGIARGDFRPVLGFVVQAGWGWYLEPRRGFSSDFAFPAARVLLEIDGGAHAAGRGKVARDVKRRGLAAAAGWRLLSVTPDQVRSGEALRLLRRTLGLGVS